MRLRGGKHRPLNAVSSRLPQGLSRNGLAREEEIIMVELTTGRTFRISGGYGRRSFRKRAMVRNAW